MNECKRKIITLSIRPDVLRRLDEKAEVAGLSRSRYIELIIRDDKEVKKDE